MSYQELLAFCYGQSVALALILGALITVGYYKLIAYVTRPAPRKRRVRTRVVAEVVEEPKRTLNQDRLFNDFMSGKFDIK